MIEKTVNAAPAQRAPNQRGGLLTIGFLGVVVLIPLVIVAVVLFKARGKELGRWELRGDPKTGFAGDMPYPPGTKNVHLYYDAVWVGSKYPPSGRLQLQLLRDGQVIETSTCSTRDDIGVGICGYSGGGEELGSKRADCENRMACAFAQTGGGDPLTLRARLTFPRPEPFRELARFHVVLRE